MKTKSAIRKMQLDDIDEVYEIESASFTSPWTKESFTMNSWKIHMPITLSLKKMAVWQVIAGFGL